MASMRVNPFDLGLEALHQSRLNLQFVAQTKTSIITPDQPLHSPQKNDVKFHSFYLKQKNQALPLTGSVGRMACCLYPALALVTTTLR